jgi:hypothetical protein
MSLTPDGGSYASLCGSYVDFNRWDEAKATAQEAPARNVDAPCLHLRVNPIAFLQRDATGMEREVALLVGKPGCQDQSLVAQAQGDGPEFIDSAQRVDSKDRAAGYQGLSALLEAVVENRSLAKRQGQAALALSSDRMSRSLQPPLCDWPVKARHRFPEDTAVRLIYVPMMRAAFSLCNGQGAKAVAKNSPPSRGTSRVFRSLSWFQSRYCFIARPGMSSGEAGAPPRERSFRNSRSPGDCSERSAPIHLLAHLGLASDPAKARPAYQDFLALRKDADPDIATLQQAKSESAKFR